MCKRWTSHNLDLLVIRIYELSIRIYKTLSSIKFLLVLFQLFHEKWNLSSIVWINLLFHLVKSLGKLLNYFLLDAVAIWQK